MPKILELFNQKQKYYFFLLLFLICVVSVLEMTSLAIIVPILNSFLGIETTSKESNLLWFSKFIETESFTLQTFLLLFIFFFIIKTLFSIFVSWKHHNFVFGFIKNLSFSLYSKYLSQNYSHYSKKNSSELLRNVLKEMDLFYLHLQSFIQLILETIILLGIFVFLVYLLTIPTLAIVSLSFILGSIYYFLIKKKIKSWGKNRQILEEDRIKFMQEGFSFLKEINFFKRHDFFLNRFQDKNEKFYRIYINFNFFNSLPRYVFELFTIVLIGFVFFFLLIEGVENDEIIKILALFFAASFRIIPSVYRIFSSLQNLKYTQSATDVLHLDFKNLSEKNILKNENKLKFKNKIEFSIKEFKHDNNLNFKIQNFNLEIKKNQKIGIIGRSGSGKSTVLDLFSCVITDPETSIKIDGKTISKNEYVSWQKLIGLIPQNISILNDTLKQNILFGLKDKVNDDYIRDILKISNLDRLLSRLPSGIDYNISEKGANLSGGEIQRIGIARALIFNPDILIFDEATSALDTFTENEILQDINSLPNKTMLMISHRMSTLKYCDKIYHLEDGRIINEGPYSQFKNN
jgi:ABC-type multidrug transport system fused ATPase/permease subunit